MRSNKMPKEDILQINEIGIYSFSEDNKTLNVSVIEKKFSSYSNIFYYMKIIASALDRKLSSLKMYSSVSADEYDLMYVMVKKIKEAVVDAYNEHNRILREKGVTVA